VQREIRLTLHAPDFVASFAGKPNPFFEMAIKRRTNPARRNLIMDFCDHNHLDN